MFEAFSFRTDWTHDEPAAATEKENGSSPGGEEWGSIAWPEELHGASVDGARLTVPGDRDCASSLIYSVCDPRLIMFLS